MRNMINAPADVGAFVLAGDAVFTLHSRKTDKHYTYRVRRAKIDPDRPRPATSLWFVQLLTGPDNTSSYTYMGCLRSGPGNVIQFATTAKSAEGTWDSAPCKGLRFMWRAITELNEMPRDMDIYHEGRCGRCGRPLTVPESLDRGIGPECQKVVPFSVVYERRRIA